MSATEDLIRIAIDELGCTAKDVLVVFVEQYRIALVVPESKVVEPCERWRFNTHAKRALFSYIVDLRITSEQRWLAVKTCLDLAGSKPATELLNAEL